MHKRHVRIALVVVDLFAAVSAFAGALGLVLGPIVPLSALHGSPFKDFTVPALLLGFVVGGSALGAAVVAMVEPLLRIKPLRIMLLEQLGIVLLGVASLASVAAGCIMVGWMVVELAMIGLGSWLQPAYLVVGLVMIGLAGLLHWAEAHPHAATKQGGQAGTSSGGEQVA